MASITKKGEQKYLIRVSKGTGSRRSFDNKIFHGTLAEARAEARDMEILMDGTRGNVGALRFEAYFELWKKSIAKKVAPRTLDGYESSIRLYALDELRDLKVGKIAQHHIQSIYDECDKSGTTVRNLHAALNACFSWAVRERSIKENPCKFTERPERNHKIMVVLDTPEAPLFIQHARTMANGIIFEFALETGMSPEEYLALRWADITGNDACIQQVVQYRRKGGGFYFKKVKAKHRRRRVPISDELRRRLHRHRIEQHGHRLSMKGTWFDHDLVFANDVGRPFALPNLTRRYLHPILEKCDLGKHLTLYGLRHSCATLLLMNGTHPKIVSERLGHASVSMTLDIYSHVLPHIQDEATEAMGRILRKVV